MKKQIYFKLFLFTFLSFNACKWGTDIAPKYLMPYGEWRGVFKTAGGNLPFCFEMEILNDSSFKCTLLNGDEQIETNQMDIMGDTLIIDFPVYESVLLARIKGNNYDSLKGFWVRTKYDKNDSLPFEAKFGGKYKFVARSRKFPPNISGRWETHFIRENGEKSPAIGIFEQDASIVKGTFLTPWGDYRYLSGIMDQDSLFLSGFDAGSAYLFKAQLMEDSSLHGKMYAGKTLERAWQAKLNPSFQLENADELTTIKDDSKKINFTFPNTENKEISLNDVQYKNKVVVLQILGTWCHNCLDETAFLSDFYEKNKNRNFEIIGLSFERTYIPEKAIYQIKQLKEKYDVDYEMLWAGTTEKESIQKALPQLEKINAYPTTIFLDKNGNIRKIHTGFSGPSTGKDYLNYKKEFTAFIEKLLSEA